MQASSSPAKGLRRSPLTRHPEWSPRNPPTRRRRDGRPCTRACAVARRQQRRHAAERCGNTARDCAAHPAGVGGRVECRDDAPEQSRTTSAEQGCRCPSRSAADPAAARQHPTSVGPRISLTRSVRRSPPSSRLLKSSPRSGSAPWPNDRYRGYVRDILDSARHGLEVVDDILRDVPNQPGQRCRSSPRSISMPRSRRSAHRCSRWRKNPSARLEAAVVSGLPRVIADRRNVRQMLLNLITNSIKHGGGAGAHQGHDRLRAFRRGVGRGRGQRPRFSTSTGAGVGKARAWRRTIAQGRPRPAAHAFARHRERRPPRHLEPARSRCPRPHRLRSRSTRAPRGNSFVQQPAIRCFDVSGYRWTGAGDDRLLVVAVDAGIIGWACRNERARARRRGAVAATRRCHRRLRRLRCDRRSCWCQRKRELRLRRWRADPCAASWPRRQPRAHSRGSSHRLGFDDLIVLESRARSAPRAWRAPVPRRACPTARPAPSIGTRRARR